jgi:hypothetical protein
MGMVALIQVGAPVNLDVSRCRDAKGQGKDQVRAAVCTSREVINCRPK